MLRARITCLAAAAVLIAAPPVSAQEEGDAAPEEGGLLMLEYFDVTPEDAGVFEEGVVMVVDAARRAELAPEYGWWMWQNGFEYVVVQPLASFAQLDDEAYWMKQFAGTPGEEALRAAFDRLGDAGFAFRSEVLQAEPSLSYTPADPPPAAFAHVVQEWVAPGRELDYRNLILEAIPYLEGIGYPFTMQTYRTRVGPGRYLFAILYDDPGAYFSREAEMMASPDFTEFFARWAPTVRKVEEARYRYRQDLSYMPEEEG